MIEDVGQAIRLDPEDSSAYRFRGLTFAVLGQHQRAMEDYNEALHFNLQDVDAYVNRALTYTYLEMDLEAQADIDKAVELGFDRALLEQWIEKAKSLR